MMTTVISIAILCYLIKNGNAQQNGFFAGRSGSRNNRIPGHGVRVEELLNPENYHKYIRPGINLDSPLSVQISIAVSSIDEISDVKMEYTITFTLYQTWRDNRLDRLNIGALKPVTMDASVGKRMWLPDTYIVNGHTSFIHDVTQRNGLLILYPNGTVIYVLRITSQVACPMQLFKYPMDEQVCKLKLASWSFTSQNLVYKWSGNESCGSSQRSVIGIEDVVLPQFDLTGCSIYSSSHKRILGNYSELTLKFELKRNVKYFILQTYVPSILLVMLSWVSFWINAEAVPARVSLGITTVLSMTTLMMGVYGSGPKSTSYVKAVDGYVLVCYGFIFSAMIEYACVHFYLRCQIKKILKSMKDSVGAYVHISMENGPFQFVTPNNNTTNTKTKKEGKSATLWPAKFTNGCHEQNYQSCTDNLEFSTKEEKTPASEAYQQAQKVVESVDMIFRFLAPVLFLAFNALYWAIYLNMRN